jgi:hypothetical protein
MKKKTSTWGSPAPRRTVRVRRAALVAVAAGLTAAACNGSAGPSPLMKENELTAHLLMSDVESGDLSNLAGIFAPTAVYEDFSNSREYQGLQEISGYVGSIRSWADGIVMSINEMQVWNTGVVIEWSLSAVQNRPIPGLVSTATGHEVVVNGVTVLEIANHKVIRAADYMDDLTMMLQLGGEMHMPGGAVLKNELPSLPDTTGVAPDTMGVGG